MNERAATNDEMRTQTIANVDQAAAWDGEEGERWAEHEERYDASARRHERRLLEAAQIFANHHVLDIGCGCGGSTRRAARLASAGVALGVDLSARMLERARERSRADGLTNVRFEQADAQVYPFQAQAFDRAISRFGAMFFADPVAAFQNIHRALRPGGRLAILSWQELGKNEWLTAMREALAQGRTLPQPPVGVPGQFGLADPAMIRRVLTEAGFGSIEIEEIQEPVELGSDADDTYRFVTSLGITKGMLEGLDSATATRALAALRSTIEAHQTPEGVLFDSRAWLTTAAR